MKTLTLIKRGNLVHIINNGRNSLRERLPFKEFLQVINHLKKYHKHSLNRDLYHGQPVYEFSGTTDNIMTTIAEKTGDINFRVSTL